MDLFRQNDIQFGKSKDKLLLQLSDVIGGSVNRFFSGKSLIDPFQVLDKQLLGK